MTHRGLHLFLNGATPRSSTARKIRDWYVQYGPWDEPFSRDRILALAEIMLEEIPEDERAEAMTELFEVMVTIHRKAGREPPKWLEQLATGDHTG